jgi:hypothetical protein
MWGLSDTFQSLEDDFFDFGPIVFGRTSQMTFFVWTFFSGKAAAF